MKEKVLIIKIGYTEFLVDKTDDKVSLGDVVRCTPILHCFKDAAVTWLTDKSCYPFLEGIPYIKRLMHYDLTTVLQLQSEHFDTIINLEKAPGICALADSMKAWKKFGFRFDPVTGEVAAYSMAEKVLEVSANHSLKHKTHKSFYNFLFEIVGKRWNGEDSLLGYAPKTKEAYDIGFNTHIGPKWPNKAWPAEYWKALEKKLKKNKYTISYQKGLNSLYEYMDWLNSCRLIITNDSLGMHLALAFKKKIIALFGPTFSSEVDLGRLGVKLKPEADYECMPCMNMSRDCMQKKRCMYFITPEAVCGYVKRLLPK